MISAVVLIKSDPDAVNELSEALVSLDGVSEVFSVAGNYDLVALVRVQENEQLADLISGRIRKLAGIRSTETLIAFRVYSNAELEAGFNLGLDD